LFAVALGWNAREGLFLAGMLMVSSSAIISKILHEAGTNHERSGQLAMGVAVLEDVVAVVMLTILNSMVELGRGGGAQVTQTPHRHQVERTFEGMRDVFSAVFFVAIGMQIDVRELWHGLGVIIAVATFTMIARPFAVSTGLTLIGTPLKDALRTGLTATPIGE